MIFGTIGGVCPESAIAEIAMESLRTGRARIVKVHLEDARSALEGTLRNLSPDEVYVETNCGGMMEIYVEPYLPGGPAGAHRPGGEGRCGGRPGQDGQDLGVRDGRHRPSTRAHDPDVLITEPGLRPDQVRVHRV